MHDQLQNGRGVRLFNVIDDFNCEGVGIEIGFSLPSERVIRALEQIIEWRGCQPGNPQQNWYVERYSSTVSHDWLNQHLFETVDEMQDFATKWLWSYTNERPNHWWHYPSDIGLRISTAAHHLHRQFQHVPT